MVTQTDIINARARLLKEYNKEERGSWQIWGEDGIGDIGSREPKLEIVKGTYKNVVEYALTLSNFFAYTRGGRIEKIDTGIKNIDAINNNLIKITDLKAAKQDLLNQIAQIDREIDDLST